MSSASENRYSRIIEHTTLRLDTLREAVLLVAGVGALGNEVLKALALLGIGHLVIVDFDIIQLSNLTRSVLFRQEHIGLPKVQVAAAKIKDLNPDVKVLPIQGDVTRDVGLGVFRRVDAVIGCLDSQEARLGLNQLCWRAGVPYLDGSLGISSAFYGGVRSFIPPEGACYGCSLSPSEYKALALKYSCGNIASLANKQGVAPTTPVEAGIIGAMLVQEALKILHGLPIESGVGRFYNGVTWELFTVRYDRQEDCPCHEESYDSKHYSVIKRRMDSLTVDELLGTAREEFGPLTCIRMPLDIVNSLACLHCGYMEQVFLTERALNKDFLLCPKCHSERRVYKTNLIEKSGWLGNRTLAELGLPVLSAFVLEYPQGSSVWEISGDESWFWFG